MATSARAKAWDSDAPLDSFWTTMAARCRRAKLVSISFAGFQRLTQSTSLPDGVPLEEVRAEMSGVGRIGIVEAYGLYWRAIPGVGIQITAIKDVGLAWYTDLAFNRAEHAGDVLARLASASCIGLTTDKRTKYSKIATMGEELVKAAKRLLGQAQKLLPRVEAPDASEMEDE